MAQSQLADKLSFLQRYRAQDEATLLAQAVQAGVDALYRDALVEAYVLGQIDRRRLEEELGPTEAAAIDQQRDALQRDVTWGLHGARG